MGAAIGALAVMTQTELLLIILGGIFVIEALSVAIQVFSFKLFRRRVLLMAPVHHHFEMMAWSETKIMLRFWIIAAVCAGIGYTLYQNYDRAETTGEALRPPLPGGPYLVVGLARSGQAAARLLAARGEQVTGCDSGSPERRSRLAGSRSGSRLGVGRARAARRERGAWSRAPGCPARRRWSPRRANGGSR